MPDPTIPELLRQVSFDRLRLIRQDMLDLQVALAKEEKLPALQKRLAVWADTIADAVRELAQEAPERG